MPNAFVKCIPFYTQTAKLIEKNFGKPIFIKEIRLEGDFSTTDKVTVQINATKEDYYGKLHIRPEKRCKQLIITPAFQWIRTGRLIIVYEDYPFITTYVGSDQDIVQLVARGASILAGQGQTDVANAGTRVSLTTTKTRVVNIRAKKENTGKIFVGGQTVSSANGYILEADQFIEMPIDASILYIDASVNGEGVSWVGWK